MKEYHKIPTVWKRDPETKFKTLIDGAWATPELEYLKDCQWVFMEKVDGTNIRVMWDGENVTFGGKTDNAQIPAFLVTRLQELFMPFESRKFLAATFSSDGMPCSVCLYGEGYGAKIQKGGGNYKADGVDFVLFDVKVGDWWLKREDVEDVADKLVLRVVPVLGFGTLIDGIGETERGMASEWGDFTMEGLVMRPSVELKSRNGQRIIAKIKHKDFVK